MTDLSKQRTAQAKIAISGLGLTSTKLGFGLNLGTMAYLGIRKNRLAKEFTYGVESALDIDGHSGSLVFGYVASEWFYISDEAFEALRTNNILGNRYSVDIQVEGTTLGAGKADITIDLINQYGAHNTIVDLYGIKVSGLQATGTSVRGRLKKGPATVNRDRNGMSKAFE